MKWNSLANFSFSLIFKFHTIIDLTKGFYVFPIYTHFITFSCIIALASVSSMMLNKSGGGNLLTPILGAKHTEPLGKILAEGFLWMFFIIFKKFPSIPGLLGIFFIKSVGFCSCKHFI